MVSYSLNKANYCEHPHHVGYRKNTKDLWLHSTQLYWKNEYKNRKYFWACDRCLYKDYEKWEAKEL